MTVRRLAASVLAVLVLSPAAAHAAAPFGFIGMNAEDVFAGDEAYRAQMFSLMQRNRVTVVRQVFSWSASEPQPGAFDFSNLDRFVLDAAQHGIRVLPLLFGEPAWATSRPPGHELDNCAYPPKRNGDFAAWAGALAARYGTKGALWQAHPGFARETITAWQIWNEPNLKRYWACRPNAVAYVKFAREASAAIRKVDGNAHIISAGAPKATNESTFLRAAFKAGAAKVFDAFGFHVYRRTTKEVMSDVRLARAKLDAAGAKKMLMIITEFGWATTGPKDRERTVTESQQAKLLADAIGALDKERKKLKLYNVSYYAWHDVPPAPGQKDFWGLHTGLLRPGDSVKPALAALARAAKRAA